MFRNCIKKHKHKKNKNIENSGEDPMLSDQQQYRYMTVDDMKSLGDDSLKIDVTRDERGDHLRDSVGKYFVYIQKLKFADIKYVTISLMSHL